MKIYTKKGDTGQTDLFGGVRVNKSDLRVEAYGSVDELLSLLGVIRAQTKDDELSDCLGRIQLELFSLNNELATPEGREPYGEILDGSAVLVLEEEIDACDKEIPPLDAFILPGGSLDSAQLQLARTVCRRAERVVVRLAQVETLRDTVIRYLNRLSDLCFALGRRANYRDGVEEVKIPTLREKLKGKAKK